MSNMYETAAVSPKLEEEGVWVDGLTGGGSEVFKIASYENDKFKAYLRSALKPYERKMAAQTLSDDEKKAIEKIIIRGEAMHVLKDWQEVTNEEGEPREFSVDAAIEVLSDPRLKSVRKNIQMVASTDVTFREIKEQKAEDVKN